MNLVIQCKITNNHKEIIISFNKSSKMNFPISFGKYYAIAVSVQTRVLFETFG